jgi:hypothetical protein
LGVTVIFGYTNRLVKGGQRGQNIQKTRWRYQYLKFSKEEISLWVVQYKGIFSSHSSKKTYCASTFKINEFWDDTTQKM